MATITVTETKFLEPKAARLRLKITVGFAQAGGSYVLVISSAGIRNEILPNALGEYDIPVEHYSIVSCTTTVQDINLSTNNTSVMHEFFDTALPGNIPFRREVEHNNDRVIYDVQYILL